MKFSMKKISTQMLFCLSIVAMSSHVMAADATINISGQVTTDGCSISPSDLNVVLPDIEANTLATTGSTSDYVPFTINFTDCPSSISAIAISYGSTGGEGDLYWANAGTATNVNAELRSGVNANRLVEPGGQGEILDVSADTNSAVNYYSVRIRNNGKGAATPGSVIVNFSLVYVYA